MGTSQWAHGNAFVVIGCGYCIHYLYCRVRADALVLLSVTHIAAEPHSAVVPMQSRSFGC
jgi:hypothetical protein